MLRTLTFACFATLLAASAVAQPMYNAMVDASLEAALFKNIEANPGNPNATIPGDNGKPTKTTLLIFATFIGDEATAKKLVAAGARTDALDDSNRSPLYYAIFSQSYDLVQFYLAQPATKAVLETKDEMEDTPLSFAVQQSDPAIVQALIKAGAKVDLDQPHLLGESIRTFCKNSQGQNACSGLPRV